MNGKLHRTNGPAVIYSDGTLEYCVEDKLHRIGGPAVIFTNGTQWYYLEDKLHRLDGPAYIGSDGTQQYWVDGIEYAQEEYPQAVFKYKLKQLVG